MAQIIFPFVRRKSLDAAEAANLALARHVVRIDEELKALRERCATLEAVVNGHTIEFGKRERETA